MDAWSTRMFVANVLCKRNYLVLLKWIHVLGWTTVLGLLGCVYLVVVFLAWLDVVLRQRLRAETLSFRISPRCCLWLQVIRPFVFILRFS